MRYLILSDIHSNLEALDAVLRAARAQKYEAVLILGDLVGYGADPNAVVERVVALNPVAAVRGNHDKVAAGLEDADDFNPMARAAANWTREALTPATLEYLQGLPIGPAIVDDHIEICHGSPLDEDLYVVADPDFARSIAVARRRLCLFGHTHVALSARIDSKHRLTIDTPDGHPELRMELDPEASYLVNPGSVGQPRDGDARAAYAIADTDKTIITLHRVAYPIEIAQRKILSAGLPPSLAYRLGMGR
jgi:predicted phosphodiesterase